MRNFILFNNFYFYFIRLNENLLKKYAFIFFIFDHIFLVFCKLAENGRTCFMIIQIFLYNLKFYFNSYLEIIKILEENMAITKILVVQDISLSSSFKVVLVKLIITIINVFHYYLYFYRFL